MSEPTNTTATPRTRRRRRWVLLMLLALLTGAAAVGWWWATRQDLSDTERRLVGRWKYRWDGSPTELPFEYEFRPDHTCVHRNFAPKTGVLTSETNDTTWWLSGNKLIVRRPGVASGQFWHVFPSQRAADEVYTLTPDGPDRFHYTGTIEIRGTPTQPPVTGTMTRVAPGD